MPVDQAPYRSVRHQTIFRVVRWCQNQLNLRDWEIEVSYGDSLPSWVEDSTIKENNSAGQCNSLSEYFKGQIWVSPERCKASNYHPVSVVIHEMLHIFFHHYQITDQDERMLNILESLLFRLWELTQT